MGAREAIAEVEDEVAMAVREPNAVAGLKGRDLCLAWARTEGRERSPGSLGEDLDRLGELALDPTERRPTS